MAPVGRTRTPKPGSFESQTANSFAFGFSPSTTRLVIRRSAMAAPLLNGKPTGETPGKHRGNTKKEVPGNLRKQGTLRNAHCKGIFDSLGKMRKLKEFAVFRMAFKRSGVRLPLAPPKLLITWIDRLAVSAVADLVRYPRTRLALGQQRSPSRVIWTTQ